MEPKKKATATKFRTVHEATLTLPHLQFCSYTVVFPFFSLLIFKCTFACLHLHTNASFCHGPPPQLLPYAAHLPVSPMGPIIFCSTNFSSVQVSWCGASVYSVTLRMTETDKNTEEKKFILKAIKFQKSSVSLPEALRLLSPSTETGSWNRVNWISCLLLTNVRQRLWFTKSNQIKWKCQWGRGDKSSASPPRVV